MNRPAFEGLRLNVPAHVKHARLVSWVAEVAALTEAKAVYWCDGSEAEYQRLTEQLVAAGTLLRLNPARRPNSFLARSDPGAGSGSKVSVSRWRSDSSCSFKPRAVARCAP